MRDFLPDFKPNFKPVFKPDSKLDFKPDFMLDFKPFIEIWTHLQRFNESLNDFQIDIEEDYTIL